VLLLFLLPSSSSLSPWGDFDCFVFAHAEHRPFPTPPNLVHPPTWQRDRTVWTIDNLQLVFFSYSLLSANNSSALYPLTHCSLVCIQQQQLDWEFNLKATVLLHQRFFPSHPDGDRVEAESRVIMHSNFPPFPSRRFSCATITLI
jgi:hypothetical protein